MSGLRRLSDVAIGGGLAGATSGQVPVFNSGTGKFGPGAPKFDNLRNLYNFSAASLYNYHAAISRARTGGTSVRAAFVGDSTTAASDAANAQLNNPPTRCKTILNSGGGVAGLTVASGVRLLNNNSGNDGSITFGSGWSVNSAAGYTSSLSATPSATGNAVVTTTGFDTLKVFYARSSGLGTCVVTVNDGTDHAQTVNTAGSTGIGIVTYTGLTPGTQTITFPPPTVASVFFMAYETYSSSNGQLLLGQYGMPGAPTTGLVNGGTTGFGSMSTLLNVGTAIPDLFVLTMGLNDWAGNVVPATFASNIQTFLNAKTSLQDCLLVVPVPPNGAQTYAWSLYVAQLYALADTNNLPLLDLTARWTDWTTSNAKGLRNGSLHPNTAGYYDVSQAYASVLAPA